MHARTHAHSHLYYIDRPLSLEGTLVSLIVLVETILCIVCIFQLFKYMKKIAKILIGSVVVVVDEY